MFSKLNVRLVCSLLQTKNKKNSLKIRRLQIVMIQVSLTKVNVQKSVFDCLLQYLKFNPTVFII